MRSFEIALFDRHDRLINRVLTQGTTRGQAYRQAVLLLGGVAARFELEEI